MSLRTLVPNAAAWLLLTSLASAQGGSPIERALALIDAGKPREAIAVLEPLRRQAGADARSLAVLGALYLNTGQAAEAWAVLEPLTSLEKPDPAVLFNAARAARALDRNDRYEPLLERSFALSPVSPAARELGFLRIRQGRALEGFELLSAWIKIEPTDAEARIAAAQAAMRLGRVSDAKTMLDPLDPNTPATRILKAQTAMVAGNPTAALQELQPLLAGAGGELERDARGLAADAYLTLDSPGEAAAVLAGKTGGDPQLSLLLARAQRQSGKLGDATATLKPIAEAWLRPGVRPGGTPAFGSALLLEYGRALVASGRSKEGSAALEKAVELNPRSRLGWTSLAEALEALGQADPARRARAKADELAQADAQVLAAMSMAGKGGANLAPILTALDAGEVEKALEMSRAEAKKHATDPRPRLLEVRILTSLTRTDEALRAAQQLVDQYPTLPDALYTLGSLQAARGDVDRAETNLRRALELTPQFPPALNDLAVLMMTQKRFAEARELLEQALAVNPNDELALRNLRALP